MKRRVVIAGLGDTGLLVALHLHPAVEVIGVTPKPCLVSGQELGTQLARPELWRRHYLTAFTRYRRLDGMRVEHGAVTHVDTDRRRVALLRFDGSEHALDYDVLVIASGVTNGFWRTAALEDLDAIERRIDEHAARLARARCVAVLGGGATGVSVASNLREQHPATAVHLFFSQGEPLPSYHPRVRQAAGARLRAQGVVLHPGHRAIVPEGFARDRLTSGPIAWATGQPPFEADAVVWAVGGQRPNTGFLPTTMLDADGYVRVDAQLRVPDHPNVFAVGDVAASDPNRSSARNGGYLTVAHNVRCLLAGREARMKRFRPSRHRWGSIFGPQRDGLRVFTPTGRSLRIPAWWVDRVLFPWIVRRGIYKGMRDVDARASRPWRFP